MFACVVIQPKSNRNPQKYVFIVCRYVYPQLWWGRLLQEATMWSEQSRMLVCWHTWQWGPWITRPWQAWLQWVALHKCLLLFFHHLWWYNTQLFAFGEQDFIFGSFVRHFYYIYSLWYMFCRVMCWCHSEKLFERCLYVSLLFL